MVPISNWEVDAKAGKSTPETVILSPEAASVGLIVILAPGTE